MFVAYNGLITDSSISKSLLWTHHLRSTDIKKNYMMRSLLQPTYKRKEIRPSETVTKLVRPSLLDSQRPGFSTLYLSKVWRTQKNCEGGLQDSVVDSSGRRVYLSVEPSPDSDVHLPVSGWTMVTKSVGVVCGRVELCSPLIDQLWYI